MSIQYFIEDCFKNLTIHCNLLRKIAQCVMNNRYYQSIMLVKLENLYKQLSRIEKQFI
jgi:flagellar biosynthesis regulator FlbT